MRVISRLYVRIVANPGSIPTRTAPLVVAITGTQEKPVSIKNLNAFERSFFTQIFKDGDWKMSSTNVMEKNNRKVEITNDSGKLTVKAIAIAKMYLASSLEPDDFKAQIETVLEALSHLELNEPIEEILAS